MSAPRISEVAMFTGYKTRDEALAAARNIVDFEKHSIIATICGPFGGDVSPMAYVLLKPDALKITEQGKS